MKPPRLPFPRRVLARVVAGRADGAAPAPDEQQRELERRLWCRARQTRERRMRKLMGPPEPPERALTHRAMEQIRYLRRAFPEEWPLARLAQGFQVPPEVIRRVLRSRFCPSPERGRKQDARAPRGALGQGGPPSPLVAAAARLPAEPGKGAELFRAPSGRPGRPFLGFWRSSRLGFSSALPSPSWVDVRRQPVNSPGKMQGSVLSRQTLQK
ncbi:neugrin [Candoia aspera]|uniref:neugrin n=1 Tax=Candoia aspera TaxID=51853 RepID=UPI002FD7F924